MNFTSLMLGLKLRFTESAGADRAEASERGRDGAAAIPPFPLSEEVRYKHVSGSLFLTFQIPGEGTIFGTCYIFTPEQGVSCGDGEEPK